MSVSTLDLASLLSSHELEASLLNNICDDDLFLVMIDKMELYEELAPYLGVSTEEVLKLKSGHWANGWGSSEGTHVSVGVQMMKEYDDSLIFPFHGAFTVKTKYCTLCPRGRG